VTPLALCSTFQLPPVVTLRGSCRGSCHRKSGHTG
jgi:hypothetical protein